MRIMNFKKIRRFNSKNSNKIKSSYPKLSIKYFKNERRIKMNNKIIKSAPKVLVMLTILFSFLLNGCGDSNISGINSNESRLTASGEKSELLKSDSTSIRLDLSLKFKSVSITDSKNLESNTGNRFYHIASVNVDLKPNEELDLHELQESGIFGLYLSATGSFTLSNSDGLTFTSKTVLMEKCEFIDLKLKNQEHSIIHVSGFVAGE